MPAGRNGSEEDAHILRRTRLRLMAWSSGITLLILLVMGAAIYTGVSNLVTNDSVSRLKDYADRQVGAISGKPAPPRQQLNPEFGTRYSGIFIVIIDSAGNKYSYNPILPPGVPVQAGIDAVAAGGTDTRDVTILGTPLRVFSETAQDRDGDVFVVQTVADRTQEANLLDLLLVVLIGGGAGALLVSLLAGYLYAGRALVPIKASMVRRQAALQRQREFAANASHELRTPLTVIRASVEDLRRNRRSRVEDVGEAIGDIDAEVRQMTALVEDMLLLARTDSGTVQIEPMPLDLADVAAEAASSLSALGLERGVAVVLDPLPAPVYGDPLRLRQLVTILTDNAIRHSPRGSTVTVGVRSDGTWALLYVEDQGSGIKPEDMPRLWERFWRADDAPAGGTGLGLAIAKWLVDQHHGAIGAMNREDGGARFWVRLPAIPPQAAGVAALQGEQGPATGLVPPPSPPSPPDPVSAADLAWAPGDSEQSVS